MAPLNIYFTARAVSAFQNRTQFFKHKFDFYRIFTVLIFKVYISKFVSKLEIVQGKVIQILLLLCSSVHNKIRYNWNIRLAGC